EVPPTVSAFLTQQHRWNKGLIQTAIKLLPRILTSRAPLKTKIEAWFHLTSPLVHVAILLLAILAVPFLVFPIAVTAPELNPRLAFGIGVLFLVLGTAAASAFYVTSQWAQGLGLRHTLMRLPALMAIGVGISVTNTRAVIGAVLRRESPFVRTPKYAGAATSAADPILRHRRRLIPPGSAEVTLGILMVLCVALTFVRPYTLVGAPFLALFGSGFLGIGLPLLRHSIRRA
ncbi:MAG: glycosyltransferase, partial [Planctomycetota bacterium]